MLHLHDITPGASRSRGGGLIVTLLWIVLAIECIAGATVLAYRHGRRRGRVEAGSLVSDARKEGVAEGVALIQAITDQHLCTDDECAIESQRRAAQWQ